MVPLGGAPSNQNKDSNPVPIEDSNALFKTLEQWTAILDGLRKQPTRTNLPQSKKPRPSPPVRRRHKKMGGGA